MDGARIKKMTTHPVEYQTISFFDAIINLVMLALSYVSLKKRPMGQSLAALDKDLRSLIQWTAIPRYLIIDKAGKIVNSNAPSPSNGPELIGEIKTYLAP